MSFPWGAALDLVPETGLVALGITMLMIAGDIDLSVGSVFALAPILSATLMERGADFSAATAAGLVAAAGIGLLNALATLAFRLPSALVTLVTLVAVRLLTWRIAGNFPALLPADVPARIFAGSLGPVRVSLLWFASVAAIAAGLLAIPGVGSGVRACADPRRAPGLPVRRIRTACFVLCAVLAGLAGTLQMLRIGSPLPSLGYAVEWQGWAAALIGGALPVGGRGSVAGAVIGTLAVAGIVAGLAPQNPAWAPAVIGGLATLSVAIGFLLRMRRSARL